MPAALRLWPLLGPFSLAAVAQPYTAARINSYINTHGTLWNSYFTEPENFDKPSSSVRHLQLLFFPTNFTLSCTIQPQTCTLSTWTTKVARHFHFLHGIFTSFLDTVQCRKPPDCLFCLSPSPLFIPTIFSVICTFQPQTCTLTTWTTQGARHLHYTQAHSSE